MDVRESVLETGERVLFRPIVPDDKPLLQEGLSRLSPEGRYLRFFSPIDHFTERQLRYLTEIDYEDHYAWVALLPDDHESPGVGVARWIRLADEPDVAEGAVTVIDAYQGLGIGKTLLWLAAYSAIERGIRCFQVWTMGDNAPVARMMKAFGAVPGRAEGGIQEFRVPLPPSAVDLEGTPAPLVLRAVAAGRLAATAHEGLPPRTRLDPR